MNYLNEMNGIARASDVIFEGVAEKVRVTGNKGVTIKMDNTYYIMKTRYGFRVTVLENYDGLKNVAIRYGFEYSVRGYDTALVIKVKDSMERVMKLISESEETIH